jgi:hypothetical protein
MMRTFWLASNTPPANQIAKIQSQRVERTPVWVSVMTITLRQRTGAGSLMQRIAGPVQQAVWVRPVVAPTLISRDVRVPSCRRLDADAAHPLLVAKREDHDKDIFTP